MASKFSTALVRHPRQSRWLDEWDRLKGGCPCRESPVFRLELAALIHHVLLSDVTLHCIQFKSNRRYRIASRQNDSPL